MPISVLLAIKFMSYLSLRDVRRLLLPLIAIFLIFSSCKKQTNEVIIDAFANINPDIKYTNGVYNLQFTLQEFPYDEVILKLTDLKANFYKNTNLTLTKAYQVSPNRYGIFINLPPISKTYYYQIQVKDISGKIVNSDIYTFTTNP